MPHLQCKERCARTRACLNEPAYLPDNDLEKVEVGDQEIRRKLIAGNLGMWTNAIDSHDTE